MLNKTMAIFLTALALLANLAIFKADHTTTTEPVPTQDAAGDPPPEGDRGGQFDPDGLGGNGY